MKKTIGNLFFAILFVITFLVPFVGIQKVSADPITAWNDDLFNVYWVKSSKYYKGVPENGMSLHTVVKNTGLFYRLAPKQLWIKFVDLISYKSNGPVPYWDVRYYDNTYFSMRNQFYCHAYGRVKAGDEWNLEVWRPNVGFTRTLITGCNPV